MASVVDETSSERKLVTVVKADISGSTALGERLDPEELRIVLGSYFAALAREIHRRGGVIDKYVGDAVFALFGLPDPRPDDAWRAVVAAVAMQEAIERENIELHRKHGVLLACRIGIATGSVVGGAIAEDVQAAYTVVGPPVAMAEALESAAPLGAVLVSPATRAAARSAIRFAPLESVVPKSSTRSIPAYRVLGLRQATRELVNVVSAVTTSASLQVTSDRQDVLAEERKIVTVLFADISTSEPLGSRLDVPELRAVLGAYFGVLARAIQRHGGTIDKYIGDAVMAVFGAPVSHEDDGIRAVGAALAILREASGVNDALEKKHGIKVSIRIGINTGEVVAGLLPGEVVAYTITGDTVNTAQRIESAAQPGEVLVSESTRDLARHAFSFEAVPPLTLKGKSQPVPAFRVIRRERRAAPRDVTPLIGRDNELERLRRLVSEALAGEGRLVHLYGEPGVGKTRVTSELLGSTPPGAARLRARCASYESETPYALVADIIRRILGLQTADDEQTARAAIAGALTQTSDLERAAAESVLLEVLGFAAASELTPESKRRLILAQLRALLDRRSGEGLVVIVENLHWIDAASADVFRDLARVLPTLRCLMLTTSREIEVPWVAETIELPPLADDSAAAMLERLAPRLDATTKALVLERTAGNPFFIEEVVYAMATGRSATVPASVQDLLEARMDMLEAEPRLVAQRASVIGRIFWTRILARVSDDTTLDRSLATLTGERFVEPREREPEPTYGFRHALVQEVAYGTQLRSQRSRAHVAVGDAYCALYEGRLDEFVDVLAYHYGRGDDDPKARSSLARAGDRARSLYANEEAIAYYRAVVERASDGEGPLQAGNLLERIGDVQLVIGKYDEAIASFGAARARIPDPRAITVARLHRKVAAVLRARGAYDDAFRALESARIAELAGDLHFRRGDHVAAGEAIRRAVEIAEERGGDDAVAEGLKFLGNIAVTTSKLDEAVELYERSRMTYDRIGDDVGRAQVSSNIGTAYRRMGRYDEALAEYERSRALAEKAGHLYGVALALNNIGALHVIRGTAAEGIPPYERAVSLLDQIGSRAEVGMACMNLGEARLDAGDVAGARIDLREAERRFAELGTTWYAPGLYRYIARAELAAGSLTEARAAAERSLELARVQQRRLLEALAQRVLAEIAIAAGEPERAVALLDQSRATLSELGEKDELARTDAVRRRMA
jgi:class 3 adenylate cyclase/tetratricopeptide (TPR) repeat protein